MKSTTEFVKCPKESWMYKWYVCRGFVDSHLDPLNPELVWMKKVVE